MQFSPSVIATIACMGLFTIPACATPAPLKSDADSITQRTPDSQNDAAAAVATGAIHFRNHCSFPVYLVPCGQSGCGNIRPLNTQTGTYQETYHPAKDGQRTFELNTLLPTKYGTRLRLEYVNDGKGLVFYDILLVDVKNGFKTTATCNGAPSAHPGGPTVPCSIANGIQVTLCG